jgi:hypothetical protein
LSKADHLCQPFLSVPSSRQPFSDWCFCIHGTNSIATTSKCQ